jgi:hypothetical protein
MCEYYVCLDVGISPDSASACCGVVLDASFSYGARRVYVWMLMCECYLCVDVGISQDSASARCGVVLGASFSFTHDLYVGMLYMCGCRHLLG